MTHLPSQKSGKKTAIGGIKFSEELVQIVVGSDPVADGSFEDVLKMLAENSINIPFLCHSGVNNLSESVFCVESKDFETVHSLFKTSGLSSKSYTAKHSVGTLTIFPHRYDFHFLGLIISVFTRGKYPVYSLSTSISTIAINTDFFSLNNIVERLQTVIELPENHAPFRQEFCLKQIQQ